MVGYIIERNKMSKVMIISTSIKKKMYLSIIILPLLGSIFSGLFGRKLGVSGSQLVTTSLVMVTTLLSILAFFEVGLLSVPVSIELFT
jgi:NADH-ubiquinone oxidoreductase chain 5